MLRIGVICPSEIALRRFMPALVQIKEFEFVGIGVCTYEERFGDEAIDTDKANAILNEEKRKAQVFVEQYGGHIFEGYNTIASSDEIDALYIPLPPALHYKWANCALECGKHVLIEKPATISLEDTKSLVDLASKKCLGLHENYMFVFHDQLTAINEIIESGKIGEPRLYRISFGFPKRMLNDFRYNKSLGGGALIDAGGYTIKYASMILGDTARIKYAQANYTDDYEVDIYGSAALVNDRGVTVQVAYGMDNDYKCELEVWGSVGTLYTGRVLTAPANYIPLVVIKNGNDKEEISLPSDDTFKKSIEFFYECICNERKRKDSYSKIVKQAEFIDEFMIKAYNKEVKK